MNNTIPYTRRVQIITQRFNALLAEASDLGPLESKGDDRSIYGLKTEVAFELPGHVLTLEVPDSWFEVPDQLDAYLTRTIAAALQKIDQSKAKVKRFFAMRPHSLELVKAPLCGSCGESMVKHDATRWICTKDDCDQNTTLVRVDGVYPFTKIESTKSREDELEELVEARERWAKLERKIADTMANVIRGKEASQANLVMKVIYDTLRSVQVWMKGD